MNLGKAQGFDARTWVDGLYRQYSDMVIKRIRFRLNAGGACLAAAEDVLIDVFATALAKADTIIGQENVVGWLYKTADNLCMNECRRQHVARRRELPLQEDILQSDEVMVQRITIGEVQTLLKKDEVALFNRIYIEKVPLQDVSDEYQITYGAAKVRAYRLRQRLLEISRQYS